MKKFSNESIRNLKNTINVLKNLISFAVTGKIFIGCFLNYGLILRISKYCKSSQFS